MIVVRPYLPEDRELLRAFIREVWSEKPEAVFDNRWWWRSPSPPLFVAVDAQSECIVGMCAHIPFALRIGEIERQSAWFVDFFVSPEQQGKGIGKLLTQEVMKRFPVTASLAQSDAAWFAFKKLHWNDRSIAKLYLHLAPALWHGSDTLQSAGITVSARIWGSSLPLEVANELDAFWLAARSQFDAISVRDSQTLQLRYGGFDRRDYRMLLAHREGELVGYMVCRTLPRNSLRSLRRSIGLVADYLILNDDPAVFRTLLKFAAKVSVGAGARAVLCMSNGSRTAAVLSRAGYIYSGTPLIGRKLRSLDVGFTCYSEDSLPKDWYLTPGDCDLDLSWGETSLA